MLIAWVMLILGLALLIKGADWFVDSASGLARRMGVSPLIIGLTIVAFGTSAPEAAVSITSSIKGSNGISLGNVIGSNIFNLLVVLGVSAVIRPVTVDRAVIKKDFPFSILAAGVLLLTMLDKAVGELAVPVVSHIDGFILLAFFAVFMYYTAAGAIAQKQEAAPAENLSLPKLLVMLVIGITAIIGGGQAVVRGASDIALGFGISETLVGLTIVAIGTSLPELVTSVVAITKGEDNIAVGNVVGSNIFNIFLIVGLAAGISPIFADTAIITDTFVLLAVSTLFYAYIVYKKSVTRAPGIIMTLAYIAYIAYAVVR